MTRRPAFLVPSIIAAGILVAAPGILVAGPAWAAPTTEVIQARAAPLLGRRLGAGLAAAAR